MNERSRCFVTSKPFKVWRIAATGLSFVLFGLGALVLGLVFAILVYPIPLGGSRKRKWTRNSIHRATWLYVRIMRGLGLLSFKITGQQTVEPGGTLLIANHPTLLDVVFILSAIPNMNCIVKSALWRNPFTFAIVTMAGYIRNDSENIIDLAAEQLQAGQKLIVFPEGTRTLDPTQLDFKRGTAHIAVAANRPVTPILIDCNPSTLRKHQKWFQVPERPPLFTLDILPSQQIGQCIDTARVKSIQVRHLTRYWQQMIQKKLDDHIVTR